MRAFSSPGIAQPAGAGSLRSVTKLSGNFSRRDSPHHGKTCRDDRPL